MKRPAWTQRKERSNIPLMRFMTWLSLRLGRRVSRIVLSPASAYFMLFSPAACRASRAYLTRALGRPATWLDVWRHLIVFGATIHDRIYLLNDRFDLFDLRVHGRDVMRDTLAEGHGAFLMGAHLGSFEVMRALGRTQPNLRVAITMYEDNARRTSKILASINPAAKQDVIGLGQVDSPGRFSRRARGVSARAAAYGGHAQTPGDLHDRAVSRRQPLRYSLRNAGGFLQGRARQTRRRGTGRPDALRRIARKALPRCAVQLVQLLRFLAR
jgi:hypothetical protein